MSNTVIEKSVLATPAAPAPSTRWCIEGNDISNESDAFLGTKDASPLIIKTANIERMRIAETGEVTIGEGKATIEEGEAKPKKVLLQINAADDENPLCLVALPLMPSGQEQTHNLLMVNKDGLIYQTADKVQHQRARRSVDEYIVHKPDLEIPEWTEKDYIGTDTDMPLIFKTGDITKTSESHPKAYHAERMRITNTGVGIGEGFSAENKVSATLHVKGSVRFPDLPAGSGTPVVIAEDGHLYKNESTSNVIRTKTMLSTTGKRTEIMVVAKGNLNILANFFGSMRISVACNDAIQYWELVVIRKNFESANQKQDEWRLLRAFCNHELNMAPAPGKAFIVEGWTDWGPNFGTNLVLKVYFALVKGGIRMTVLDDALPAVGVVTFIDVVVQLNSWPMPKIS